MNKYWLQRIKMALLIVILLVAIAFSLKNKNRHWLIYTSGPIGSYGEMFNPSPLTFDNQYLFINDQDGNTYGVDSQTGKISWTFDSDDYSPFSATKLDLETIAINSFDANTYAVDLTNGLEKWRFTNPNNTYPDTNTITDENDQSVFFGDRVGTLYALDKKRGEVNWSHQLKPISLNTVDLKENSVLFGRLFQDDDNLYVRSSTEEKLIAFNKKSGEVIWENSIKYDDQDIFIRSSFIIINDDRFIYAIDKKSGKTLWKWKEEYSKLPNKEDINEDSIYLTKYKRMVKINPKTGIIIWGLDIKGEIEQKIIYNEKWGYLHYNLEGSRSNLIAFNLESGLIDWEKELFSEITFQYLLGRRYLILGSFGGEILILDFEKSKVIKVNNLFINGKIVKIFPSDENIILVSISKGEHAIVTKLSSSLEKIWSFKTTYKVDDESIHFKQNRVLFTDKGRQLIASIDTTSNSKFEQSDFDFRSKMNKSKKEIMEMNEVVGALLPNLFKETNIADQLKIIWSDSNRKIANFFRKKANDYQQIKKDNFSISHNYNQSILEITIDHQLKNMGQPLDKRINISAEITSPSKKEYHLSGFIYQKNTWKVRFRPDEAGVWNYQLKLKTPLGIKKITFEKSVEINQASQIQYIKFKEGDKFNFYLEDGSQFHPLGLEDMMLDINNDLSPLNQWGLASTYKPPAKFEEVKFINFDEYLKLYADAGFNFYRWGVGNYSFTLWQELSEYEEISLEAGRYGDMLVKELRDQNYRIMMSLFGFHPPFPFSIEEPENKKIVQDYLDYVVPRYASYVDIWEITNEAEVSDEWLEFVIDHVKKIDPYNHPISTNWDRPEMESLDLLSIHWFESEEVPSVVTTTKNNANYFKQFQKPVLFSEMGNVETSWDVNSAQRMRVKLWTGLFNQAYFVIWNQPRETYLNDQNANIYLGPKERVYTKVFSKFINDIKLNLEPLHIENKNLQIEIFGLKNKNKAYIYIAKTQKFINLDRDKIKLPFNNKKISWLDPETGLYFRENITSNDGGVYLPPFKSDIVGVISL